MIQSITGSDTLVINDRVLNDLADGDNSVIVFPNNLVEVKTGKNKNTVFVKNETGNNAEMTLRIMRGSADDAFLQQLLTSMESDFSSFTLLSGTFVKKIGDGAGTLKRDEYTLSGGVFTKKVDGKENVEGDTEQAIAIYTIRFAIAKRGIA